MVTRMVHDLVADCETAPAVVKGGDEVSKEGASTTHLQTGSFQSVYELSNRDIELLPAASKEHRFLNVEPSPHTERKQ